jgi:hypothetical protein
MDEGNNGRFPGNSAVEVNYPRSKQQGQGGRSAWPRRRGERDRGSLRAPRRASLAKRVWGHSPQRADYRRPRRGSGRPDGYVAAQDAGPIIVHTLRSTGMPRTTVHVRPALPWPVSRL